jgi:hypothetical protein
VIIREPLLQALGRLRVANKSVFVRLPRLSAGARPFAGRHEDVFSLQEKRGCRQAVLVVRGACAQGARQRQLDQRLRTSEGRQANRGR